LIAFTNVLDKKNQPLVVFKQPITIKSIRQQDFKVTLNLMDTAINDGVARVKVNVIRRWCQIRGTAWINAIHKDQLPWTQVSNLKAWDSPVVCYREEPTRTGSLR
jgi:hypothetical protein